MVGNNMSRRWSTMRYFFGWILSYPIRWQLRIVYFFLGLCFTTVVYELLFSVTSLQIIIIVLFWFIYAVFCMFTCFISSEALVRPINSIKNVATLMAVGDLSSKAEEEGCRELRELSFELNSALKGLKLFIAKINEQADILNSASSNLKDGSEKNKESAAVVIESMQELSDGASQQANQLSDAAENVQTLSTLIHDITSDTEHIAVDSITLSESATEGLTVTTDLDLQINNIFNSTQNIARVVQELSATSEHIFTITSEIEDIAEQTNLLALNAAIEAARAGEHGKGFAVVAAETGKLSHRSMEATNLIKKLLDEMSRKNRTVIEVIDAGVKQATKGKELSGNARVRFEKIFSTLNSNIQQIGGIAESAKKISQKSERITETISSIASFSEETLASTEQVLATSQEQNKYTIMISDLAINLTDSANILKQSITIYLSISYFGNKTRSDITQAALNTYSTINQYIKFRVPDMTKDSKIFYPILKAHFKNGNAPDIIQINQPWLAEFKEKGDYFINLYEDQIINLSGFDRSSLEMCSVDGNLMGLPTGLNSICFLSNNAFLKKYNISTETTWTWESLREVGARISNLDSDAYLLYAYHEFVMYLMRMYIRQKTGMFFILDDFTAGFNVQILADAFAYFKSLVESHTMCTLDEYTITGDDVGLIAPEGKRFSDVTGMICSWISDYDKHSKGGFAECETSIMMPPVAKDAKISAIIMKPQLMLSVYKKSENAREAMKFLNWIYYHPDGVRAWGTSRGTSPTEEGRKIQQEAGMVNPIIANALNVAVQRGGVHENALSSHSEINELITNMNKKVFSGLVEPGVAAAETMKRLNKLLKVLKKRKAGKKKFFGLFG
jgi:methyl-accepting chemotaxis protein/ABC-type glycerol-3-phosphate transport system substrate-binding protein